MTSDIHYLSLQFFSSFFFWGSRALNEPNQPKKNVAHKINDFLIDDFDLITSRVAIQELLENNFSFHLYPFLFFSLTREMKLFVLFKFIFDIFCCHFKNLNLMFVLIALSIKHGKVSKN